MVSSCEHPHTVRNKYTGELISVPCGKCAVCLTDRSLAWSVRCQLESLSHRYTQFLTLTYSDAALPRLDVDELLKTYVSDSFYISCLKSVDFIDYHHGHVPCCSVDDIQKFLKRLRFNLYKHYDIPEKERCLRYYIAFEYGPTTFRPHYHCLFWYDSDVINENFKDCVYKAWQSKAGSQEFSKFFKRNRCELVRGNASQYVTGYLNSLSDCPPILKEKPFRVKSLKSSNPPIGALYFSKEQFSCFLHGDTSTFSFQSPTDFRQYELPVFTSFENRFFPRCKKFAQLSFSQRVSLYSISSLPFGEQTTYKEFELWLLSQWFEDVPLVRLLREVISEDFLDPDTGFPVFSANKARRLFYQARHVRDARRSFGYSLPQYLRLIEQYYSRKDYKSLLSQLQMETELSNRSPISYLKYYPCFIDSQFYNNERNLSTSVYQSYLDQFGLDYLRLHEFLPSEFPDFKSFLDNRLRILDSHRKNVAKKDYLARHPEWSRVYFNLIF